MSSYYYYDQERENKIFIGIVVAILIFIICCICVAFKFAYHNHDCIATVTDKERHEDGYYLIFCKDMEGNTKVFKDDDTFIRGKYNSSDMYQEIEINKTYLFHLNGYRNQLFSWYENILRFEEYESTLDNNQQNDDSTINQSDSKLNLIPKVTEATKSPYDVTIQFYSDSGIAIKKLYKPEKSNELDTADSKTIRDTIISNGTDIFGESFEVSENGVYWLYIQEISGEEYTQRFIIENFQ